MQNKLIKYSLAAALGQAVYVTLVALIMKNAEHIFGNKPGILPVVSLLMMLVLSAAVSGALILGKPVLMYFEGKKKEAVKLFIFTISWLAIIIAIIILILSVLK